MKKMMSLLLAAMLVLGLAACGGQASGTPDTNPPENSTPPVSDESTPSENPTTPAAPETVTITSLNGNREPAELEVPYDPQRIAMAALSSLAGVSPPASSALPCNPCPRFLFSHYFWELL